MSRKTPRPDKGNPPPAAPRAPASSPAADKRRRNVIIAAGVAMLLGGFGAGVLMRRGVPLPSAAPNPALASTHSPSLGDGAAKVHIVEFLDPACETCAVFYPMVKQMLVDNPNRIRLSVRHVPFHPGSEDVVRMLEASRKQGKYWQTLETLLQRQSAWVINHTAHPDLARQVLKDVGLNFEQIQAEMRSPEINQRMERDSSDAKALNVTQTPEYFVNGEPMPSFGRAQLQKLVRDALAAAY